MATCISNYLAAKILNSVMHRKSFALENVWVGLHISNPGVTGDPSTELTGGSYERIQALGAKWSSPSNATVAYQASLKFHNLPPSTISHIALWTLQAGGNIVIFGPLSTPITVADGGSLTIGTNDLAVILQS